LLTPQRGLIATVKSNSNRNCKNLAVRKPVATRIATTGGILPESSKFDCLPGKAGGTPDYIRLRSARLQISTMGGVGLEVASPSPGLIVNRLCAH
jgi:hypothetical protein